MKVISNKGKEWGDVSIETENYFNAWLNQSELEKEELLARINEDSFNMVYLVEKNEIRVCFRDNTGNIGLPFMWIKNGKIPLAYFKTDAALILLYISSLCNNDKSKEKIKNFIDKYKLNK